MDSLLIPKFIFAFHIFTCFTSAEFLQFSFAKEPNDTAAFKNEKIVLDCSTNFQNFTQVDFRWRKNETFLDNGRSNGRFKIYPNGSLVILPLIDTNGKSSDENHFESDQAFYQCFVTIDNKWTFVSRKAHVIFASVSRFEDEPEDKTVFEGEIVQFSCQIFGKPIPKISWYKDNAPVNISDENLSIIPASGSLQIKQAKLEDQGYYKCKLDHPGQNEKMAQFSREGRLKVVKNDINFDASEPKLVVMPKGRLVKVGDDLVLECAANGQPEPQISWLKDRKPIELSERIGKFGQGSLVVRRVEHGDAGFYTCRASNAEDSVDASATIVASYPPQFAIRQKNLYAKETQDVEFECKVVAKPTPTVTWLKNGEIIVPSDYFVIDQAKLKIYGLVKSDEAIYQCLAENEVGSSQTGAQLIVEAIELTEQKTVKSLPSIPLSLKAVKFDGRTVTLQWDPPSTNRNSVLGYTVFYKREGSDRDRLVNVTAINSKNFVLDMLTPDSEYFVKVAAFNKNGLGSSSPVLKIRTAPNAELPQTVRNMKATVFSPNSVEIRWDPPPERHSVTFYKLLYQVVAPENKIENSFRDHDNENSRENSMDDEDYMEVDENDETEIQVNGLVYTLHGLKADTVYRFKIGAVNKQGGVSTSEPITAATLSDVPSAPPRNVSVSALTADSAVVRWSPPSERHQNGKILSYRVRYRQKIRGSAIKYANVTANETQKLIAGLQTGLTYNFAITAATINGTGPYSEWTTFQLTLNHKDDYQVLGPVTDLTLEGRGTEIHLAWAPPQTDGTVQGYKISWGPGIPDVHHELVGGAQRYHVIKDLRPNKQYVVCIRAYNKVDGFPVYETVRTTALTVSRGGTVVFGGASPSGGRQLKPPVQVRAMSRSATGILVTWLDQDFLGPNNGPMGQNGGQSGISSSNRDGRLYNVSVSSPALGGRVRYARVRRTSQHLFEQLRPNTRYEFAVQVVLEGHRSEWSMSASNQTFSSAPTSSPTDLTIVQLPDNPTSVIINWMPPKHANGVITEYLVYYTTDSTLPESKWLIDGIRGDRMTTTIDNVVPDTEYTFKIQAKNEKGHSPISMPRSYRTASNGLPVEKWSQVVGSPNGRNGGGLSPFDSASTHHSSTGGRWTPAVWTIGAGSVAALLICLALTFGVCLFAHRRRFRHRRRQQMASASGGGVAGGKDLKPPPDLWIDHRIRNVHVDANDDGIADDVKNAMTSAAFLVDGKKLGRSPSPASSDNQPPRYHSLTAMPSANCGTLPRNYRHNVLSGSASNNIDGAALLPPHSARYHPSQQNPPSVVYTGRKNSSNQRDDCSSPLGSSNALIYGANPSMALNHQQPHSNAEPIYTAQSNRHSNPLKSFTVLTNPPPVPPSIPMVHMQSTPTAKIHFSRANGNSNNSTPGGGPVCMDNRSPAPKLGSASVLMAKNKQQQQQKPLLSNAKLYSPAKSANFGSTKDLEPDDLNPLERSCSTEELSVQMRNLDNLMKDLNEISANEFDA